MEFNKISLGFSLFMVLCSCAFALDFDPNPDVVIYDHQTVHNFGRSVAVCDINNDTHPDLIVGDDQGNNTVYVYYGGPFDRAEDLTIRPPTLTGYSADAFGFKLICGGDLNGDGVSDLVVSDPVNNYHTFVYFGGPSFNGTMNVNIIVSGRLGYVMSMGDLNNDSVDDLALGGYSGGAAYVYFGGASFDNTSDIKFIDAGSSYSDQVSAEGDLNDDGVKDLVVSSYSGKIYVYYGGSSFNNVSDMNITLDSGDDGLATAGDLNGDSVADLVVSGSNTYVLFGGHNFNNVTDINISGIGVQEYYAMLSSADLNNDGFNDLVVSDSGPTYVFYGGTVLDNISDANISSPPGVEKFGWSMAAGDLNEDGVDDLVIGAATYRMFGNENSNKVYVYHGATSPHTRETRETWSRLNEPQPTVVTLQGKLTNSTSGAALATASVRVNVSNSSAQVWSGTFNNVLDSSGVFNLALGASDEMKLTAGRVYSMEIEVDLGAASFSAADVTFGDESPSGDVIKFTA